MAVLQNSPFAREQQCPRLAYTSNGQGAEALTGDKVLYS